MQEILTLANKASTTLAAYDGYCVEFDTSGINVCNAITDQAIGVITKGAASGGNSDVCVFGQCLALAGGTVTAGKYVTPHTDGTVIVTAGSGCTEFALALESGVAGDWVKIFVLGGHKQWA
jgi:hypothetical protein